jgi:aspartate-semialdehyde dehydrogenase
MKFSMEAAVVGAGSAAGIALLEGLRDAVDGDIHGLGREASEFHDEVEIGDVAAFDFERTRVVIFAGDPALAAEFAPRAAEAGALAIDCSSHFRFDPEVPLVIPEVNPESLAQARERGIVACPDPCTVQLLLALHPLHLAGVLQRVDVVTLLGAVAGGQAAIEELGRQTADLLNFRESAPAAFARQIAFNAIPLAGDLLADGRTSLEAALAREAHKIFADEGILITATTVQVPVFFAHSQSLQLGFRDAVGVEQARAILGQAAGVRLVDGAGAFPTAVTEASGHDQVFIGRLREQGGGLSMWTVADALQRGVVANALGIVGAWMEGDG